MELSVDQALQQGIVAHKEGKFQQAEKLYCVILSSQPNHPDANHNFRVLAVGVGKVSEALSFFKRALEATPKQGQLWLNYTDAIMKVGQLNNVKQMLKQGKTSGLKGEKVDQLEAQLISMVNSKLSSIHHTGNPGKQQIGGLSKLLI